MTKHLFIVSDAGKLVYARHRNHEGLYAITGLCHALISAHLARKDPLRWIDAGNVRLVFLDRPALYLVLVASFRESVERLTEQLRVLYLQFLTVAPERTIARVHAADPGFDFARLIAGFHAHFDQLVDGIDSSPSFCFNALPVPALDQLAKSVVRKVANALLNAAVAAAVLHDNALLDTVHTAEGGALLRTPVALSLLLHFVRSTPSFRNATTWTPWHLPEGAGQKCWVYVRENGPRCIVALCIDEAAFHAIHSLAEEAEQTLDANVTLEDYTRERSARPNLRHVETYLVLNRRLRRWFCAGDDAHIGDFLAMDGPAGVSSLDGPATTLVRALAADHTVFYAVRTSEYSGSEIAATVSEILQRVHRDGRFYITA